MSYRSERSERIKEFIKSPIGLGIVLVLLVMLIILIMVSVIKMNATEYNDGVWRYSELDPASGEEIWFSSPTNGNDGLDEPRYVGFDKSLISNGVTSEQYAVFRDAVSNYAESIDLDLFRVSYSRDSYSLKASYVFDFKIVLNIDQITLDVELNSSAGWKNILGMFVKIADENGKEVYRLTIDESNICDYQRRCELIDDGT